jgi:hypothetical protein
VIELQEVRDGLVPTVPDARRDQLTATKDQIANGQRTLAQASTLPEVRRVMEVASVAADAARRAAWEARTRSRAKDLVRAANEMTNDAASLRIEAQAKAGEMIRALHRGGHLAGRGRPGNKPQGITHAEVGIDRRDAHRWQRLAAIPAPDRERYVAETKAVCGEVTTAGLFRYAAQVVSATAGMVRSAVLAKEGRGDLSRAHRELVRQYASDPRVLVAGLGAGEREELSESLSRLVAWADQVRAELDAYRPTTNQEGE